MVSLAVWASVTDRQTDRQTATSMLMQRLEINDDVTKVFSKKYFQNTILFYIFKILFLSIFNLYF